MNRSVSFAFLCVAGECDADPDRRCLDDAWNRWSPRPRRSIDVLAVVLAVAEVFGAFIPSARVTSVNRLALFVLIGARIVRSGPMRVITLASSEPQYSVALLDPIGAPGIWF